MSDTDSAFGAFRCTSANVSHYFLPGKRRPLCGARQEPGDESLAFTGGRDGRHYWRQPVCPACVELNVERWRLAGGQGK